jgi:hypothetical protein
MPIFFTLTITTMEYIYVLQSCHFFENNIPVYKIGRTGQSNTKRFFGYPKDTKILFIKMCKNSTTIENNLLNMFDIKYAMFPHFGREYFIGDVNEMIKDIENYINSKIVKNDNDFNYNEIVKKVKILQQNKNIVNCPIITKELLIKSPPPIYVWKTLSFEQLVNIPCETDEQKISLLRHNAILDLTNNVNNANSFCNQYKLLQNNLEINKEKIQKIIEEENLIINEHYDRVDSVKNFRTLVQYSDKTLKQTFHKFFDIKYDNGTVNCDKQKMVKKLDIICEIMKLFDFNIKNNISNYVNSTVFNNIANLLNSDLIKKDFEISDLTYKNISDTVDSVKNNTCKNYKAFIGLLNSILGRYCLKIKSKQTSIKINKKVAKIKKYEIKINDKYNKLVDIIMTT